MTFVLKYKPRFGIIDKVNHVQAHSDSFISRFKNIFSFSCVTLIFFFSLLQSQCS